MKPYTLLLLSFLVSFNLLFAQTNNENTPYIEVVGTASQEVSPDMIFVEVSLVEKTVGKRRLSISKQESNFWEIVNRLEIDPSKVVLSGAIAEVLMKRYRDKGTSYKKTFEVELKTAEKVSKFFEQLSANGIREVGISRTDHSDMINIRKNVRVAAIKAAKEKANYLCEAIGQKLGKPKIIREEKTNNYLNALSSSNTMITGLARNMMMGYDLIPVSFSYYIKYEVN